MEQTLTLQIPDEVYRVIARSAQAAGRTVEDLAAEWLAQFASKPLPPVTSEEAQAARQRFRRYFGVWDSGDPHSADNERIDADLAREYSSTHEEA